VVYTGFEERVAVIHRAAHQSNIQTEWRDSFSWSLSWNTQALLVFLSPAFLANVALEMSHGSILPWMLRQWCHEGNNETLKSSRPKVFSIALESGHARTSCTLTQF